MVSSKIVIVAPQTEKEFEAYFLLRYQMLRKPWNKPKGSEKDDMENKCIHAMAIDENNDVVGVCRLQFNSLDEAQIRYMAVAELIQGKGIGKTLISYLENKAREKGIQKIILQSRSSAVEFYIKCGYQVREKSYLMWGEIQHFLMEKNLK